MFRSLAGFGASDLLPDILAGLMLAAIAIPEQMATAKLGAFPPQIGFIAFVAATLAFVVFGASRYTSVGADSTITPIFAAGLALIAEPGQHAYLMLAGTLAALVGAMLVAAGLLRAGWIANLLSIPVTTGFLAGIAVHIAVSQLPGAIGVHPAQGDVLHELAGVLADAGQTNFYALALAIGVLAITLLAERLSPRIPGALLGFVLAAGAVSLLDLDSKGVEMLGPLTPIAISASISPPHLQDVIRLIPLAVILSLVIMVQSAATARSFPSPADGEFDFDRDLVGMGAANLLAAVAGAFPVNSSPPRTAIAAESGARTQICGLTAAALVGLVAVFGSELLRLIPSAALAGILFFVSWRITRVRVMLAVWRQSRAEFFLIAATVLAIVVLPVEIGVGLGIVFSVVHGMWTTTRTRLIELKNIPGTTVWWPLGGGNDGTTIDGVRVVAFQAPLSFLNAEEFGADFAGVLADVPTKLIVLEASGIAEIDFTAAQTLKDAIRRCRDGQVILALARLESVRARAALERFGVTDLLKPEYVFRSVDEAIKSLAEPLHIVLQ